MLQSFWFCCKNGAVTTVVLEPFTAGEVKIACARSMSFLVVGTCLAHYGGQRLPFGGDSSDDLEARQRLRKVSLSRFKE